MQVDTLKFLLTQFAIFLFASLIGDLRCYVAAGFTVPEA